jgi:hypothetical protein
MDTNTKYNITREKIEKLLPKGSNYKVTDEVLSLIDNIEKDTGLLQEYAEESILNNLPILREVRVSFKDYVDAVKYVQLKQNMSNNEAWELTFPDKYSKLVQEGRWNSSHVSYYNSRPIVVKLEAQKLLDYKALYAPVFYQQIQVQSRLAAGTDANGNPTSGTVQQLASKTLLELLKPEEANKLDITIGLDDESKSIQQQLMEQLKLSTDAKMKQLESGETIETVQKLGVNLETIEVECE